ncbi:uncharacterized protein [Argopecten irradians]|uniref:uncharacterized protein isoform X2 n=1 Tax=Argopecten irradians TaxID=31199 RepID=UPI003720CBC8
MQLDFNILLVILILICFIIYILSYLSFISFLIITFIGIFVFITGRSISERCATKLKSPANLEFSTSTKKKKKTQPTHSNKDTSYRHYPRDISIDENMHRNGFSNSSFNDKKFDRSFDKWRSPVASPVLRSPGIRISSPVVGTGLRTRKASQIISRRHSFSVKPTDTTIHSESGSRVPFLPTIKRALGLETIVSPRYTGKDDYNSFTSHPETASPGFIPAVRLSNHDRHPLSKVRSSSIRSPNTIKIAPPDPNKLGSPRVLEVRKYRDTATDDNRKTPDMQSVLTALKEKRRKRTAGPPEEDNFCHEAPIQKSKRRRQESQQSNASTSSLPPLPASLPDLSDYSIPRLETPSLKRTAAPETSEWEGRGSNPKRLRQEGRYNSITSSLSSSRYLERNQRSYSPRPDWSHLQCEGAQDQSGKENLDVSVTSKSLSSNLQDPDSSSSSLQRAETVMLKPGLDSEDQSLNVSTSDASLLSQSQNKSMTPRQKVTLNKSFSVRKRQMSLYTGLNKSFSKVPKSNVVASMEDYEADREAEQRRVEQMLQDIVSTEEAEKDKGNAVTTSTVSSAVITTTASTSKTGLPSLSANPLLMSKATTSSTATPATVSSTTPQTGQVSASNSTLPSVTSTLKTTSVNQVLPNTSVASAPSNNMFSGLASSATTAVSSSSPATISSSKGSGGFSMTSPVISNTQSDKNSAPSTKLGFQAAEARTVGAALASIVAAAYPSKSSEENVSSDKSTTASTNLGSVPNTAATNLSSLASIVPCTSVSNGFGASSGFGAASNVMKTTVADPVSLSGITTASSAFSVSSANKTGFSFGNSNVSQPVSSAPSLSFGSTTPATLNNNTSTNPTVGAGNIQISTAPSSFGAAAPSTQPKFTPVFGNPNPTTQANVFGASTGNTSTFGSTSSTFATPQNKTTFGNPAPEAPKAAGGFTFGGGATSSAPVFGAATNSAPSSTTSFPIASSATAASTFNLGNTTQTTTAASTFNFGNTTTQATSSSKFNFGASNPTTTPAAATSFSFGGASNSNPQPTSTFNFGGATNVTATATTTTANSTFNFGGNQTITASTFNFGGASNTKPQAASSTFNFGGASNTTPQTTSSTFSFGGTSNPTTSASTFGFGATSSTQSNFNFGANAANSVGATPAFGAPTPQVNTATVFGGSKPQASGTFHGGMTKSGSAPAFGDTGPSFGGGSKPSNPFGTSATFGGTAAPPASQTTNVGNNVFGFGATAQQPSASNTGGFNFNAAGAGSGTTGFNFGGNAVPTGFGAGSPAPAFGQAPSTPGQGMFTVGASNSAAKPRVMSKAKRRGARR